MDKKTYTIGILAVVAALLLVANLMPSAEPAANASFAIKDRNYQLVTARATRGGELLYVVDNLSGQVAVFVWDNNRVKPLVVQSLVGN
jgi:hypothetical protein